MKISTSKVDSTRVEAGEWVSDIPDMGNLELRVRGINNADYRALQHRLIMAVPFKDRKRGLRPKDQDRINVECLVRTVLTDWRNFEDDDDKPVAYSQDVARSYLENPDYGALRDAVSWAANVVGENKTDADAAIEKNSAAPSAMS